MKTSKPCLIEAHPHLLTEWDFDRNVLDPHKISVKNNKRAHWVCSIDPRHKWEAIIFNRSSGTGCPYCQGRKVDQSNSLATLRPGLASEWDHERNTLTPHDVTCGSNKKVYWICSKGHSWEALISTRNSGNGCQVCSGKVASEGHNLMASRPDLALQWDYDRNRLRPDQVSPSSGSKVHWICPANPDHRWEAKISNRSNGTGCPYCCARKVDRSNSLATLRPDLAIEWDYQLNTLTPHDVSPGTTLRAHWICPANPEHKWETQINTRNWGNGCPHCRESKGEKMIAKILDSLDVLYKRQHRFKSCKNLHSMPFDFAVALPSFNPRAGVIEYQGEQHFRPVEHFGGIDSFEKVKARDQLKREWCRSKGVPFLAIPYWALKNIRKHVEGFVNNVPPVVPDLGLPWSEQALRGLVQVHGCNR